MSNQSEVITSFVLATQYGLLLMLVNYASVRGLVSFACKFRKICGEVSVYIL